MKTFSPLHWQMLARPQVIERISQIALPLSALLSVIFLALGLYEALVISPPDYQQGDAVRIMYVHVPAAWMALFIYAFMGILAIFGYVYRHLAADLLMKAAAPVGAVFTALTLLTGMIWGHPIWGTAWVWDARLTSVLVLFFLYLGYFAVLRAYPHPQAGLRAARVLVILGLINLPVIKFSVDWWATLHQPASVLRLSGPAIDPSMLTPLLLMASGFFLVFISLLLLRYRYEKNQRILYIRQQQMMQEAR